jgi:hypothetical protein
MKTTGWLALTVIGLSLTFTTDLDAAWGPLRKKGPDYRAKPYKFKKWKAPKAGKARK